MKYLLDKNALSSSILENESNRTDLCILQEVLDEAGFSDLQIIQLRNVGIEILKVSKTHLEMLKKVMQDHGDNLRLISLISAKGMADVVMIAYSLAEKLTPQTLFAEEYVIVTKDDELKKVAQQYGLSWTTQIV